MKKNKYQIITLSISALVILVSIIGYTYSYFSASVKEINKTETLVKTNELNITYTGGQEINAGSMIPGDSFTKTFSVENKSNKAVTFNIYMENVINEFNEDLVYTLSDEEGTLISNRILPTTSDGKKYLKANIQIEANATKNYTLTVEYKYLSATNQNINLGATFSATVGIDTVQNVVAVEKGTIMIALNSVDNPKYFWQQRENITKVVFEPTLLPKENATYSYDVSEGQDKSVMSYLVENEENPSTYTLYLQGEGSIKANEDSGNLFWRFTNLTEIEGLECLDTSNVVNMGYMFAHCNSLINLDLSSFNTNNLMIMEAMFYNCKNLETINLTGFNTKRVTNMRSIFDTCNNLLSIKGIEQFDTSNVISMSGMFRGCSNLTSLDLSNFNTSNVTTMWAMFIGCNSLSNLDISHFDTNNVTDMYSMFNNCFSLTNLDLSSFDTSKVKNMNTMFYNCKSLTNLDLSNFNLTNVENMDSIFALLPNTAVVKVKDEYTQNKILSIANRPSAWTTDNVIVVS